MHHLLVTIGSHGDTHPFVGLGVRLKKRGHRVTVAANGAFREMIERAGLAFEELGTAEQYREALERPDLWHPKKGFKAVFERGVLPAMKPAYEVIERLAAEGDIVVTADAIASACRGRAGKAGRSAGNGARLLLAGFRDSEWQPQP